MPDLIAQGTAPEYRWRRTLPPAQTCILGRDAGFWSVPWDNRISRRHAELCWKDRCLEVRRIAGSRNPIFVRGREEDVFTALPGEHFVIGDTTFILTDERVTITLEAPRPVTERTFSAQYLKDLRFRDADERIEVLSRIPEIISSAASDEEMFVRLLSVLLSGIPHAVAAAVVAVDPQQSDSPVTVLHWDRRTVTDRDFQPSDKLIRQAVSTGESVVHVWSGSSQQAVPSFNPDGDWAYCTPITGKACAGWAIYVAGGFSGDASSPDGASVRALRDDLKYTELVATTLGNLREVRLLERSQTGLRQFFSPVVSEALAGHEPDEVLAPRETEVSVLFCDLRGFARQSEQAADDLLGLLHRVSDALGVTTHHILDQGGVVGDFHGDAAMGFWGWPFAQEDAVARACRAALDIRAAFEAASGHQDLPLADFSIGIGIATGRAVAGKIGTVDQVKVTVFGPVVNLAARLEGMTKLLRAPILLDETTAAQVRALTSRNEARVRRVAVVKPYGFDAALEVSELLPPQSEYPALSDDDIAAYEAALEALLARNWEEAFQLLHNVPPEDRVKDFLTVFIAQHNRTPPDDWDGVIPLASK
ncbi:MAG: adenylate/guanylate cyclase domain-containing protein [Planctomycetes bacterium]|nr:adenylate/guanylate cyclase domain-containing protein [Planctomycetota bacterium]MBL7037202.1 adenylate/guanylate cyclase domain-containing protein [Pirellulaceae bacterium]